MEHVREHSQLLSQDAVFEVYRYGEKILAAKTSASKLK
jgi:hypothetical protein